MVVAIWALVDTGRASVIYEEVLREPLLGVPGGIRHEWSGFGAMKAIMLAAGIGARLDRGPGHPPKALLEFAGRTLFERHIEILRHLGVAEMVVVTGYRADDIHAAIAGAGAEGYIRTLYNPDFAVGPLMSLWTAREELADGDDIVFMNADVLYDYRLMQRLLESRHPNCFLMDRDLRPGEDPVKICLRDGVIIDFHKEIGTACDLQGEWPGFLRLTPSVGRRVVDAMRALVDAGRVTVIYEEAFRDALLAAPAGTFKVEDITGLPWGEIDFPEDLARAHEVVLPQLEEIQPLKKEKG